MPSLSHERRMRKRMEKLEKSKRKKRFRENKCQRKFLS